jgi:hypothetical protein
MLGFHDFGDDNSGCITRRDFSIGNPLSHTKQVSWVNKIISTAFLYGNEGMLEEVKTEPIMNIFKGKSNCIQYLRGWEDTDFQRN